MPEDIIYSIPTTHNTSHRLSALRKFTLAAAALLLLTLPVIVYILSQRSVHSPNTRAQQVYGYNCYTWYGGSCVPGNWVCNTSYSPHDCGSGQQCGVNCGPPPSPTPYNCIVWGGCGATTGELCCDGSTPIDGCCGCVPEGVCLRDDQPYTCCPPYEPVEAYPPGTCGYSIPLICGTGPGGPTATPGGSTPTKTPTRTLTPSPTEWDNPTFTPTKTPTRTLTPSYTPTGTHTPSNTPTNTPTPTNTNTPTNTPSHTPTRTPTLTYTPTPTPSHTPSPTPSRTPTPTLTYTPTLTLTPTIPPSITPTPTPIGQCLNIKIYKDGVQISPPLVTGDTVLLAVTGSGNPTMARFRINQGAWMETTNQNIQGEFILEYVVPDNIGTLLIEAEVYVNGAWK